MVNKDVNALEAAFASNVLTNGEIFDAFGEVFNLSYDDIQKARRDYRAVNNLPPLRRGPKRVKPLPESVETDRTFALQQPAVITIFHQLDDRQFTLLIDAIKSLGRDS